MHTTRTLPPADHLDAINVCTRLPAPPVAPHVHLADGASFLGQIRGGIGGKFAVSLDPRVPRAVDHHLAHVRIFECCLKAG